MKKKVVNIQKNQQIKYTKLIITILFLIAIAAVSNYSETIAAEKARKRSGYSYPNLYDSKIDHTLYGDDLYSKIPTNVPINIDEKTVTVQGQKIFYLEAGRGNNQTILLLHGYPTSSNMYKDLMLKLADKFHLIAPDYIGYGEIKTNSK